MNLPPICGHRIPIVGEDAIDGRNKTFYVGCTKRLGHHLDNRRKRRPPDMNHTFKADWKATQAML